jgi:predicted enzyme related to lactoylglutathione lyase
MKNSLNWFEIPVLDFKRAQRFYSDIFDFEMPSTQVMGYDMGFFDVESGGIGGAIVYGDGYFPSHKGSVIYLNAQPDLQVALDRVEKAGGHVLVPKTLINDDLGYFAFITDTEGNKVALHSMK